MKTKFLNLIVCLIFLPLATLHFGCGNSGGDGDTGYVEGTPLGGEGENLNITPFTEATPYKNIDTYIGDTYEKDGIDPDATWVNEIKARLDSMPAGEYLSRDEYNEIVQRQTEIEYKFDTLHDYYRQLEENHSVEIDAHTAVEFALESYCLNIELHPPASGSVYDEVVPLEEHLKKMFEWYYSRTEPLQSITFQDLIWGVQNFVHNNYDYDAFSHLAKQHMIEIFGSEAESYLGQMKVKYGNLSAEVSKSIKSLNLANESESALYLAKLKSVEINSLAKGVTNNTPNGKGYFNLGNGLIGRFLSKTGYKASSLEVINNTEQPIKFEPFNFMLKQQGKDDYQPIGIGSKRNSSDAYLSDTEKKNQELNATLKLNEKPTCNMTEAQRANVVQAALPSKWLNTSYANKNSKEEGVVCNQYVRLVYAEAGITYPDTNTHGMPGSQFFEEIDEDDVKSGDVVLWLETTSKNIHHMGIWIENPEDYGGSNTKPILSARGHNGLSQKKESPNFVPTVDWTSFEMFNTEPRFYRFRGAGVGSPNCQQ